ncbi:MAG: type IV pilus modification PilV family protein [Dehalogenimonas sp.]
MAAVNKIKLKKNGFSLIEVLIALFILTVVGVAFLISLQYALKANMLDDTKSTAESIARSQLEFIKKEIYLNYSQDVGHPSRPQASYGEVNYDSIAFSMEIVVIPINPDTYDSYSLETTSPYYKYDADDGIQKIEITITFNTNGNSNIWGSSVELVGFKVRR